MSSSTAVNNNKRRKRKKGKERKEIFSKTVGLISFYLRTFFSCHFLQTFIPRASSSFSTNCRHFLLIYMTLEFLFFFLSRLARTTRAHTPCDPHERNKKKKKVESNLIYIHIYICCIRDHSIHLVYTYLVRQTKYKHVTTTTTLQ